MASTVVVSARVDEATALRAAAHIKAEGLTVGEVIKRVWENLAAGGEIPDCKQADLDDGPLVSLKKYREEMVKLDDWFINMTDEQMKDILGDRDV